MSVDLGVYYGLTTLAEVLIKRVSYLSYQNHPENFDAVLWARASAFTKTVAGFSSKPISNAFNNMIAAALDRFNKVERVRLQNLPSHKKNAHVDRFLKENPTLILQSGKPLLLVDGNNRPMPFETHCWFNSNAIIRDKDGQCHDRYRDIRNEDDAHPFHCKCSF